MEDVIRRGQERLRNLIPGGFGSFKGILLIVLAAIVIWMLTGFFRVQPNQQAGNLSIGTLAGEDVCHDLPRFVSGKRLTMVGDAVQRFQDHGIFTR